METKIQIEEPKKDRDYFPCLFANKDKTILIFADSRTSDKTFSGMIIHSSSELKNSKTGLYSTGWTYAQFTRLTKGTKVNITLEQED